MIVLDASVIIAYLDREDIHHARAEQLLADLIDEDFRVNPLTLAEVFVAPARQGRLEAVRAALLDLEMAELPLPDDAAVKLAKLRADTGLTMPDCCVLLTADDVGARVASFDDHLNRAATVRNVETRTP